MHKAKSQKGKHKKGVWGISVQTVNEILHRIAGGETLTAICREEGMPHEATFRRRVNLSSDMRSAYAEAQEQRTLRWAEEIMDIADDGTNDWMEKQTRSGPITILNDEHVRRSQLRIDSRKWLLARLMPKQYGDRVEHTGEQTVKVEHDLSPAMLANLDALRARLPSLPASVSTHPATIDVTPTSSMGERAGMEAIKARVREITTRSDP